MTGATRERLVATAERLFAERGVDAVSLREICRAADQNNGNAARFHFGDRRGLIDAIRAKHERGIGERRDALLDLYEAIVEPGDLRALVVALVLPAAGKLDDPDGGHAYLAVIDQLLSGPEAEVDHLWYSADGHRSVHRWRVLIGPLLPDGAAALHRRFAAVRLMYGELARRARSLGPRGHHDNRLFVSNLTDQLAALLATPLSDQTRRLATAQYTPHN